MGAGDGKTGNTGIGPGVYWVPRREPAQTMAFYAQEEQDLENKAG